jgi:hypothetical protein
MQVLPGLRQGKRLVLRQTGIGLCQRIDGILIGSLILVGAGRVCVAGLCLAQHDLSILIATQALRFCPNLLQQLLFVGIDNPELDMDREEQAIRLGLCQGSEAILWVPARGWLKSGA